jgi:hypothetical protein
MPQRDGHGGLRVGVLDSVFFSSHVYQLTPDIGGWTRSAPITPTHSISWVWPDMSGGLHFYGHDSTKVYHSYWHSGQFQGPVRQVSGTISGRGTQLDGLNNLHTFWVGTVPVPGGTTTGLRYQCLDSSLAWANQEILSGYNSVASSPLKASDDVSRVALAWQQSGDDPFHVAMWQGCAQEWRKTIPFPVAEQISLKAAAVNTVAGKVCVVARMGFASTHIAACATPGMAP